VASRLRLFTKRFFIYANIALVLLFVLSCLAPWPDPRQWWFLSLFGLAYPILLLLTLLFMIGWLILGKPRLALISGVALLLGLKSLLVFFAFHAPAGFKYEKNPEHIRVVTWNVARFIELKKNNNRGSEKRKRMLELLRQQNADVLCLQEFYTSSLPDYYDNITPIRYELGYPYFYFVYDTDGDQQYYSSIIFSRYPIVDSGVIRYPRPSLPEVLLHADLKIGSDTVRVYTTHLQSLQFRPRDYERIERIKSVDDSLLQNSRNIISKIKRGFMNRSIQANLIREVLDDSPHPVIMGADLNDVPNSYTYHTVRGGMQDAFLKKGFGIGRTYSALSPTLRIDYLFADPRFRVHQFSRVVKNLSDHYLLVADLEWRKDGK
jgi:endonuclease/exonuclease/phosphatase family metal-dependent hydrolase